VLKHVEPRDSPRETDLAFLRSAHQISSLPSKSTERRRQLRGRTQAQRRNLYGCGVPRTAEYPRFLWNQAIRQVAAISVGGDRVRVVLSNEYGSRPLVIGAAHIALSASGAGIVDSAAAFRRPHVHHDSGRRAGH